MQDCYLPIDKISKNGQLVGLIFEKLSTQEKVNINTPLIISSIGSLPEKLDGISIKGELFSIEDPQTGKINGYENVVTLGNVVTGRGNIKESITEGRTVSKRIMDEYLEWEEIDYIGLFNKQEFETSKKVKNISNTILNKKHLDNLKITEILKFVKTLQHKAGYNGNYQDWIKKHLPQRLEILSER